MATSIYVGVTDSRWFHYLAARRPDEVNFWMPGASGFAEENWIPVPKSWSKNIVRGKGYNTDSDEGKQLLDAVRENLYLVGEDDDLLTTSADEPERPLGLIHGRLGQGALRALVTDAYTRRCAISGERTLPALEAAHI